VILTAAAGCGARSDTEAATAPHEPAPPTISSTVIPVHRSAPPASLTIPKLDLAVNLERIVLDDQGVLVPPESFDRPGWYVGSAVPGDIGPAVIAGHVDSRDGPAVFYDLRALVPGDVVEVGREDGSSARFVVIGTDQYPKDEFPTQAVYGPTPEAELRLITCGGTFDRAARSYRDNLIVYAAAV
jgi:sortase (surface protein transpeptidase)